MNAPTIGMVLSVLFALAGCGASTSVSDGLDCGWEVDVACRWKVEVVSDDTDARSPLLALDPCGSPVVLYAEGLAEGASLEVARWHDGWATEPLRDGLLVEPRGIAVSRGGDIHWLAGVGTGMEYGTDTSGHWEVEEVSVDGHPISVSNGRLALSADGAVHLRLASGSLLSAWTRSGDSWIGGPTNWFRGFDEHGTGVFESVFVGALVADEGGGLHAAIDIGPTGTSGEGEEGHAYYGPSEFVDRTPAIGTSRLAVRGNSPVMLVGSDYYEPTGDAWSVGVGWGVWERHDIGVELVDGSIAVDAGGAVHVVGGGADGIIHYTSAGAGSTDVIAAAAEVDGTSVVVSSDRIHVAYASEDGIRYATRALACE